MGYETRLKHHFVRTFGQILTTSEHEVSPYEVTEESNHGLLRQGIYSLRTGALPKPRGN